jgi:hypothetical protein
MREAPIRRDRAPRPQPDEESAAHHLSEREPTGARHLSQRRNHLKRETSRHAHLSALISSWKRAQITPKAQFISDSHGEQITHHSRARGVERVAH